MFSPYFASIRIVLFCNLVFKPCLVFPEICFLLVRASAQGIPFAIELEESVTVSPTTYAFLSDHISRDCLNKPNSFKIESSLDTISMDKVMQCLQTVMVVKAEESSGILNYCKKPNIALAGQEKG